MPAELDQATIDRLAALAKVPPGLRRYQFAHDLRSLLKGAHERGFSIKHERVYDRVADAVARIDRMARNLAKAIEDLNGPEREQFQVSTRRLFRLPQPLPSGKAIEGNVGLDLSPESLANLLATATSRLAHHYGVPKRGRKSKRLDSGNLSDAEQFVIALLNSVVRFCEGRLTLSNDGGTLPEFLKEIEPYVPYHGLPSGKRLRQLKEQWSRQWDSCTARRRQ